MSRQYKKKATAIFAITEGEDFNNKKFDLFRNDRDCVLAALQVGESFSHYPQSWLGDKEMSLAFVAFRHEPSERFSAATIGTTFLDDKEFAIEALGETASRTHLNTYLALSHNIKPDHKVATFNHLGTYLVLSNRLKADMQIAALVLECDPDALLVMDAELRSTLTVIQALVTGLYRQSQFMHTCSPSLRLVMEQLGLPLARWEMTGEVDDMQQFIDRRAFSQSLEAQLPAKSVNKQFGKI